MQHLESPMENQGTILCTDTPTSNSQTIWWSVAQNCTNCRETCRCTIDPCKICTENWGQFPPMNLDGVLTGRVCELLLGGATRFERAAGEDR